MEEINAFRDLLLSLADVFSQEDREGGQRISALYRENAEIAPPDNCPRDALDETILAATEDAPHSAALSARAAHGVLPWSRTGILDEQIPDDVSRLFAVVSLVGPTALIKSDECRGGLFVQRSDIVYPAHSHAAEETYAMLAGSADWQCDFGPFETRETGALIHHPSYAAHATRTGARPILAAWRWSGDIRPETYRMLDSPGSPLPEGNPV